MTRPFPRLAFAAALGFLVPSVLCASTLIGTVVTSSVETITEINGLIDDYNSDFSASLPQVQSLVDKIEGVESANFTEGIYSLSDFDFYAADPGGSTLLDIFDTTVSFETVDFSVDGFDDLDNSVFAFDQQGGPSFGYYVSKDGNDGWSLWLSMPGINPAYTDAIGGGFTRGDINNNALSYDPITSGVSHLSFYQAVPEPGSCLLLAVAGLLVFGVYGRPGVEAAGRSS